MLYRARSEPDLWPPNHRGSAVTHENRLVSRQLGKSRRRTSPSLVFEHCRAPESYSREPWRQNEESHRSNCLVQRRGLPLSHSHMSLDMKRTNPFTQPNLVMQARVIIYQIFTGDRLTRSVLCHVRQRVVRMVQY